MASRRGLTRRESPRRGRTPDLRRIRRATDVGCWVRGLGYLAYRRYEDTRTHASQRVRGFEGFSRRATDGVKCHAACPNLMYSSRENMKDGRLKCHVAEKYSTRTC
eukprot:7391552-Prymnesium_polylepis.3